MKKISLCAILFLALSSSFAQQNYTISGGLLGGANAALFTNKNVDYNAKFGFDAGVWANFPLGSVLSIEPQLMYSQRGYTPKDNDGSNVNSRLGYLSMPLFLKANLGEKFAIMAGPEFNYLASSSDSNNNFKKEDFKEWSTAITGGVEFAPHSRLAIYLRYNYGLVDMFRADDGNTFITNEPYKNSSLHLGIKWKLFGHKVTAPPPPPVAEPAVVAAPVAPPVKVDPDTDGDGIVDSLDLCPKTPGISSNYGCPEITLYYKRDVAELNDEDKADLERVIKFLNNHPDVNVMIEGHTSTLGADDYNQKLSEKRANGTVDYLVSKGISKSRLTAVGFGEKYPIGDNSTEEGRAASRRTVVKINK